MSPYSVETFLEDLQKSRLLSDAQLISLRKQAAGKALTAEALSDGLVTQKHITEWQAKQLLKRETGFILDHYQLLNPVGRGGMGHVFRGADSRNGDIVAVKVMAKKLASNKTLVSRFRREIRASSKLNSPHIVKALDAGRVGKVDFMVMEFVNGDQVDRIARVLQKVSIGLACEIVRQAAVGLQHAHEHGMVHRDIKPANLMVHWSESGQGVVKLMDMGLVLLTDDDTHENTVTRAGQVMGTPDFMSPEQGWDTATVDIRSDIYSLGCTLYRLLTGTVPFSGSNPLQVLSQRLQRDAPSVQTVCTDIPDHVAAIVSRMTLRDPTARYQHPSEVAAALQPVCELLTRQALKTAATLATNNTSADFGKDSDEEVDESDGTYRQFLREVQDGSAVNLMMGTGSAGSPAAETMPILDLNVSDTRPTRNNVPRRGQKTSFLVMAAALVGLIGLLIFVSSQNTVEPKPVVVKSTAPELVLPSVTLPESDIQVATTGERWAHSIGAQFSEGTGRPGYRLSASAPPGISVSDGGELTWDVPLDQTPATYQIEVVLTYKLNNIAHELDQITLPVKVAPGFSTVTLPEQQGQIIIPPEEVFSVSAASESEYADRFNLKYQLVSKLPPDSLLLNADTGVISWTPTVNDIGRHQITIAVFDKANPDQQHTTTYRLLVRPTKIQHALPNIPIQTATAGETFRLLLPRPKFMRSERLLEARVISPGPLAPSGLSIDRQTNEVVWTIPLDISGQVEVPLLCQFVSPVDGRPHSLEGQATLIIQVAPAAMTAQTQPLPAAEDIQAAIEELQQTLSRTITQARTTSSKAELARRLVEQSQFGEGGVSDAALLSLVEAELASKSRATNVLLQIANIRRQRYGVDPSAAIEDALSSVRKTGLSPLQQDLTIEYCLQLAHEYSAQKNFAMTEQLLTAVGSLLGRTSTGAAKALDDDVDEALGFATLLVADATNNVAEAGLSVLLNRWQFQEAFTESTTFTYVQLSAEGTIPALEDSGRSAWTAKEKCIDLKAESAPVDIGLIMAPQAGGRFVLRFDLLPASNCCHLLFGVNGTSGQNFNAYRFALNQADTGAIQSLKPRATLARPSGKPRLFDDQSNMIELVVDGTKVSTRINGVLTSQADIPELTEGRVGLLADLRIPSPTISIRNVRILPLPESK